MTSLSDFFADHDIESLRVLGLESHGIDIAGVYCLHTGRKVGSFDDFVMQFACDEEATDSQEDLIDALVTRCVASMRPTPMLNKPDRVTLMNFAAKHPVDILSYLENRLYSNRFMAVNRAADFLDPYIRRITTHQKWTALSQAGVDLAPWIHWLLELDAKRNLHELTPPTAGTSDLFSQVTLSTHASLLEVFEQWVFARLKEFDTRDKEVLQTANFMRGNSMTQNAFARSWLENPQFASKRAEAVAKKRKKLSSESPLKPKRAKPLDDRVAKFLHLLDDIIDGDVELATPKKPAPILRTGATLFRKKESI